MSNSPVLNPLNKTGLEVVKDMFFRTFTRPLQLPFLEFTLDASQSELVITSLDESAAGDVGIYRNGYRWPYAKANLTTLVPYPLALQCAYPLAFWQLKAQLMNRYQILLEEGEFALSAGAVPLTNDDMVDSTLINNYAQFTLYASSTSGRFIADSHLQLIFIQPDQRVPLRGLFDLKVPNILDIMATN